MLQDYWTDFHDLFAIRRAVVWNVAAMHFISIQAHAPRLPWVPMGPISIIYDLYTYAISARCALVWSGAMLVYRISLHSYSILLISIGPFQEDQGNKN